MIVGNRKEWMVGVGRTELPTSCSQSVQESLVGKMTLLDSFVNDKKATKGLTTSGEYWLRENLSRFLTWLTLPIEDVRREQIVEFLAMMARGQTLAGVYR